MTLVTVKPKFRVTIPAKLRKDINLQEGDIMEAVRVDDGILFRVKRAVDQDTISDRIASTLAEVRVPPEDTGRSENEVMEDAIAEISASRRERRDHEI
ncbi:MAG: AbrB/MazE/SpoVT family DNA-binding domain-containing protein [Gammaproteobacteria bacterium]|nr:AbrB/MazE/SpoVT family DNA-binding domain-containing protein [Gammaproteobacteria bacterium]MYD75622.1 AbrB/MazE/SpoVT family DNA-binding domain-containing protein [Gammaproteobacteria bacterium]MYJ51488.1 AbrB/MazE/SpoVT family DNA-binding domain-containing protein [Gammaproteobacteria bacterium]